MNPRLTPSQLKPPPIAAVLALTAVAFLASVTSALGAGDTTLVNEALSSLPDDSSTEPAVSKTGQVIAFSSSATNLSDDDGDGARDVFVRDMREETIVLVSRSNGIDGAGGQADSTQPSISASGRYVAFTSLYDEFTDEDAPGLDVFVRDLKTGTTTFVSRASGVSGVGGDANSHSPSISGDGRYVAFESNADNLHGDANDVGNVFVRDLKTSRTLLVSRPSGNVGGGANGTSASPSISGDGQRVAFESTADNLSRADDNGYENVFVRDIRSSKTLLVSKGSDNDSFDPDISATGRSVAFVSRADTFSPAADNDLYDVFVRNLADGRPVLASRRSGRKGEFRERELVRLRPFPATAGPWRSTPEP